ncbi:MULTISPECIES: helix-turn-helix transcriptional regulator [Clostridium]|uniref:helix-turn-helix domain-containing protein n=1 Tax=Clostridium TaxID=1485 RepID=UPI002911FB87|nr:helix-turn-helix transcriptional regulator [Clostridium sp.]MDU7362737.1 helix-turn-helix transcriptional regulator [Clostridium sp.]
MLHDLLKELREDKGLTQIDLAEILNVSRQTISGYETGSIEPPFSTLVKLADIYNCSLDYLAGRTKERFNLNLMNKDTKELLLEIIEVVQEYKVKKK